MPQISACIGSIEVALASMAKWPTSCTRAIQALSASRLRTVWYLLRSTGVFRAASARAAATQGQADKAKEALQQAVQEYRKVFVNYPRGAQVPTALYKEALALEELKQVKLAQARLQYLVDNFPQSQEAPLARERLKSLGE